MQYYTKKKYFKHFHTFTVCYCQLRKKFSERTNDRRYTCLDISYVLSN